MQAQVAPMHLQASKPANHSTIALSENVIAYEFNGSRPICRRRARAACTTLACGRSRRTRVACRSLPRYTADMKGRPFLHWAGSVKRRWSSGTDLMVKACRSVLSKQSLVCLQAILSGRCQNSQGHLHHNRNVNRVGSSVSERNEDSLYVCVLFARGSV